MASRVTKLNNADVTVEASPAVVLGKGPQPNLFVCHAHSTYALAPPNAEVQDFLISAPNVGTALDQIEVAVKDGKLVKFVTK